MNKKASILCILTTFILLLLPISHAVKFDFKYDNNGNMLQDQYNKYTYNKLNQLIKVYDKSNKLIEEYSYDHLGQRIKKIEYLSTGKQTIYYLDSNLIKIVNTSGSFYVTYYKDANNKILAKKDTNNKKYYFHSDHLGSTALITDSSGNTFEKTEYLPFGGINVGGKERFLFTGKEKDETDLSYYESRYYSSDLRQFVQPDSMMPNYFNPQSLNRYSYVLNNPYKYTDSTGHYIDTIADIGSIILSVADLIDNPTSTMNWIALGADVVTTLLPGVAGGGLIIKSAVKADDAIKVVKKIQDIKGVEHVKDLTSKIMVKGEVRKFKITDLYKSHAVNKPKGIMKNSKHVDLTDPIEVVWVDGRNIIVDGHGRTIRAFKEGRTEVLGTYTYKSSTNVNKYADAQVQSMEKKWVQKAKEHGKVEKSDLGMFDSSAGNVGGGSK